MIPAYLVASDKSRHRPVTQFPHLQTGNDYTCPPQRSIVRINVCVFKCLAMRAKHKGLLPINYLELDPIKGKWSVYFNGHGIRLLICLVCIQLTSSRFSINLRILLHPSCVSNILEPIRLQLHCMLCLTIYYKALAQSVTRWPLPPPKEHSLPPIFIKKRKQWELRESTNNKPLQCIVNPSGSLRT